jgi:hypothetical protein
MMPLCINFTSISQRDHLNEGREGSLRALADSTAERERKKALECLEYLHKFFQKYNVLENSDYYKLGAWSERVDKLNLSKYWKMGMRMAILHSLGGKRGPSKRKNNYWRVRRKKRISSLF